MTDNPSYSWFTPGKKPVHPPASTTVYINAIAETDETGGLYGRVDIQRTGQRGRLIRHDTDRLSIQTDITDNDVLAYSSCISKKF